MVFLWLILLSILLSRSICVASNDRISSFPMLDNIALCISHLPYLYVYWCTFRFFSLSPLLRIMLRWMYRSRLHPSSFVVQLNSKTNLILKMVRVLEYFFFFFQKWHTNSQQVQEKVLLPHLSSEKYKFKPQWDHHMSVRMITIKMTRNTNNKSLQR